MFPEAGATSLVHEPGTPGYVTEYHNAVWAGLANGLCATPFWWEYWPEPPVDPLRLIRDERWQTFNRRMASFNQSVLGGPLLHLRRFVAEIDFAGQSWHDAEVSVEGCDGWAKRGDKQTFGWIVHPQQSVAGRKITIRGLRDGTYEVRFYRTWTGEFLPRPAGRMPSGRNHHHRSPVEARRRRGYNAARSRHRLPADAGGLARIADETGSP